MVAASIIVLYTKTWKFIVQQDVPSEKDLVDFIQTLPTLRDCLSCAVCRNVLCGDALFSVELCDHFVCKDCKGLPREDKNICGNCRDWQDFSEDETLFGILSGHSRYCRAFLRSSVFCTMLLQQQRRPGSDSESGDVLRILEILREGAKIGANKKKVVSKFKREETLNPPLQLHNEQIHIPSGEEESTRSENISSTAVVGNNYASTSSSITRDRDGFSGGSNFNIVLKKEEKKLVQVILEKDSDDSIDIKIEPVYQLPDGEENMDDSDSSNNSEKSGDEEMVSEEEDEEERDGLPTISEDTEAFSGQVTIQPQLQPPASNPITTSVSFSIASSSPSSSSYPVAQQQQVIYARTTSLPQTVVKQLPPNLLTGNPPGPQVMQFSPPRQIHSYVLTRPVATSSNSSPSHQMQNNYQPILSTGVGGVGVRIQSLQGGQAIRLARLALPDGRMVRQVLNAHQGQSQRGPGGIRHIALPIKTSDLIRKKIIVRPVVGVRLATPVTTTHATMQRWPDANAVLQYASGSGAVFSSQIRGPHTFTVSQSQVSNMMPMPTSNRLPNSATLSSSVSNVVFTSNTHTKPNQASNIYSSSASGSAIMNHLLAAGASSSGSGSSGSSSPSPGTTATFTDSTGNVIGTTLSLPEALRKTVTPAKVRIPNKSKSSKIRSGCRCGNAASQPSKLTCCGQRCTCYVDGKSCIDCKCRGCNNPYIPGGKKLMQGLNAVIDTKTNTTVPINISSTGGILASGGIGNVGVVSSTMNFVTTSSHSSSMTNHNVAAGSSSNATVNLVSMIPHSSTSMAPHIFTRIHHPGSPQPSTTYSQIIPVANFAGQFGQFTIPLPISLISPANNTLQSHSDTIHLQNIQLNPNLNLQNHNHNQ